MKGLPAGGPFAVFSVPRGRARGAFPAASCKRAAQPPPLAVPKSNAAKDQIPPSAGEAGGGASDGSVTARKKRARAGGSIIFIKYADFVISER